MSTPAHRWLPIGAAAALAGLVLAAARADAAPRKRPRRPPAWARHAPGPCPRPYPPTHLCAAGRAAGAPSEAGRAAAVTRARTALAGALQEARGGAPGGDGGAISEALEGSAILAVVQTRDGTWHALAAVEAPARRPPPPR